jgi:hypothetical protein
MAQGGDATDAKTYYGYLFEANKQPTKVLDALLRGIAIHIVSSICGGSEPGRYREQRLTIAERKYREERREMPCARQVSSFL